jgi:integrase
VPTETADYLDLRGKTYYLRMRVPAEFADVEPLNEINRSLKTRDKVHAKAQCAITRAALFTEWRARRAGKAADNRAIFDASIELLKGWGMSFSPMEDLLVGPVDELLSRIEAIAKLDPNSPAVPAALGAIELPDTTLEKMAERMPLLMEAEIQAKNARQRREWLGNYKRAAKDFAAHIGTRTILTISEQDAADYEDFWKKRAKTGEVTTNYANKQVRYVRQMIDAHFDDIRLPKSKRINVFKGMRVEKLPHEDDDERKKLAMPERWIRDRLVRDRILEGLDQEASDIAIIAAICGCRASEVYDLPEADIHLDHPIPHLMLRVVQDGPYRRQLKGPSSKRTVVLLGAALEAMLRHPQGFTKYRGKATYSGKVNGFLRDNDLFPPIPKGKDGRYVISGTRHSFEDRMIKARIPNEERAYLMGHSIGRVRGRPVYGSDLDIRVRALLQEMITFETQDWKPRPVDQLWEEIDRLFEADGYRLK